MGVDMDFIFLEVKPRGSHISTSPPQGETIEPMSLYAFIPPCLKSPGFPERNSMRKRNRQDTLLTQPVSPPHMLTIPEVAALLKIGRTKVYGLNKTDNFPVVQIGSAKRVPIASLNEWLEQRQRVS